MPTKEYFDIYNKFILNHQSGSFNISPMGLVSQHHVRGGDIILDFAGEREHYMISDTGDLSLKFDYTCANFTLRYLKNLKSVKNIPTTADTIILSNLSIRYVDVDKKLEINELHVLSCYNLITLANVLLSFDTRRLEVRSCYDIRCFSQLPIIDSRQTEVHLNRLDMIAKKDANNSIKNLTLENMHLMNNFKNLSTNLEKLNISTHENCCFQSFSGIETYDKLVDLSLHRMTKPLDNMLLLLTCKSLTCLGVNRCSSAYGVVQRFMHLVNKQDYVMDCAVRLIESGFEKAAEL